MMSNRIQLCVVMWFRRSSKRLLRTTVRSMPVTSFGAPPAIRGSQTSVTGISVTDGLTVLTPAVNQYENCLRCHGSSAGKVADTKFGYLPVWAASAGDPLNIIPQFSASATSSHPVTHNRSSALPQPSLRAQMLNLDGTTPGRSMSPSCGSNSRRLKVSQKSDCGDSTALLQKIE